MKTKTITIVAITLSASFAALADYCPNPARLLFNIQYADIAGVATATAITNTGDYAGGILEVDVKQWWLGSMPSNRFEIANATLEFTNADWMHRAFGSSSVITQGMDVVFFAETRWKQNSSPYYYGSALWFNWDYTQTFTNAGQVCSPRFRNPVMPSVFPLDTNATQRLNILSNLTESMFVTRDAMRFYRAARDAYGVDDNSGDMPYKAMMEMPLWSLMSRELSETQLVECVNDVLLRRDARERALKTLIWKFGWPDTSTVPVP